MTARLLTGKPYHPKDTTFLKDAIENLINNPGTILLVDTANGKEVTAREVHQKASAISKKLSELGVGNGDIVVLASNATIETFIFSLGVWLSGAATACINPFIPLEEIQRFFEVCQNSVVYAGEIVIEKVKEAVEGLGRKIHIIAPNGKDSIFDLFAIIEQSSDLVIHVDQPLAGAPDGLVMQKIMLLTFLPQDFSLSTDHCIAVLFTSGTTGVPKGVRFRDGCIHFNTSSLFEMINDKSRVLSTSPIYWISWAMTWTGALLQGNTLLIADRLGPEQLLKVITEFKPTFWFTGPAVLLDMCNLTNLEEYDTSSLIHVFVGGAVLFADKRRLIIKHLFNDRNIIRAGYGSTEAGGMVSMDYVPVNPDSPQFASIGQTGMGAVVKIVDTITGELLPPYAIGEICVKSPSIIKSYINKEITEKELDKDGFWHMGDTGYYDDLGYIYYQARATDLMKYRGQQIAPAELEAVIQKHPDVFEAAVVGKPSPEYGELPTAFVVLKPNSSLTEQELYEFVSNSVIDEKKLRGGVYFLERLPKNAVGKILRRNLIETLKT